MSTAVARRHLTVEEYLELDADAEEVRYEYLDGRVWALAGAAPPHTRYRESLYRLGGY
jgi:Uma2 family endonuclease